MRVDCVSKGDPPLMRVYDFHIQSGHYSFMTTTEEEVVLELLNAAVLLYRITRCTPSLQ